MIRSFDGIEPTIADSAYVDEASVVIGDVELADGASVWPNATLRGDHGRIVVGRESNVQDGAVLHEDAVLEPEVTVGHNAIVHAATVAEAALVGMNAVVLDDAHVGEEAVVAAGAVVTEGTEVPPRTLVAGVPAEPKTELEESPTRAAAAHYTALADRYEETDERID
ncbi:gamma carbonic anhydrase family protein [Halobaculum gomorrense]|uniref:Carbonic anhydrase or acetyltransferase, isoleucine patch superfamily n=1 Tax=Halobaculum gomorrense TaxID=43928 RepID=A0A1M5S6X3_9EURY|nr:gamma carbonic anhydrase family protein [Halobaculum gomorrense]SHH34382.1 Carbonic anhydrase or acetyltransferase, isoleucine patch superfamily [Halobaculum gomorrense]